MEGTSALAKVYGLKHALMMDIGGTTTDVGIVEDGTVAVADRGAIEDVQISYPMSDVTSAGIGGSSVIQLVDGELKVGPKSVGAAPGPACFGFGGKQATITDVNLLLGILDPDTYLNGRFQARPPVGRRRSSPRPSPLRWAHLARAALIRMEHAYFQALSTSFAYLVRDDTTLLAFGGAGPMSAAGAARLAGVKQVLIRATAAVFSAFGISFSDIGKTYEVIVPGSSTDAARETYDALLARAERDMFQEGYSLADCETSWQLLVEAVDDGDSADGARVSRLSYQPGDEVDYPGGVVSLQPNATAPLSHPALVQGDSVDPSPAPSVSHRSVRVAADRSMRSPCTSSTN